MIEKLINILRHCVDLGSIMVCPLSRWLGRNKVRILCYHRVCDLPRTEDAMSFLNVPPEVFAGQMAFLAQNNFNAVTLEQFIDYKDSRQKIPPRTVIVTFDDGYRDNYLNALPVLSRHNLKGTFFVVTGCIGSDKIFPWLKLEDKSLAHARENKQYWQPLGQEDILAMDAQGACFGSHTRSHCNLTQVDESEAMEELIGSKESLEKVLARPVRCFAYPYGGVNEQIKKLVKSAGYGAAVSTRWGGNTVRSDFLELRRITIEGGDSLGRFTRKVDGAYDWWFGLVLPVLIYIQRVIRRR